MLVALLIFIRSMEATLISWFQYSGTLQTTTGVVSTVSDTWSIDGRHGAHIYCIAFTFTTADGSTHYGKSYCSFSAGPIAVDEKLPFSTKLPIPGDHVHVEFRRHQPAVSRIAGMRSILRNNSMFVIFFLLIAPIFLIQVCWRFRKGWIAIRLLERGQHAQARFTDLVENRGNTTTYTVNFAYTTQDGSSRTITSKCSVVKKEWLSYDKVRYLHDCTMPAPEETVLYDPIHPQQQMLLTEFSSKFKLNADGSITGDSLTHGVWCCVPPAICCLVLLSLLI